MVSIAVAPAIRLVGLQRTFAGWYQKRVAPATTTGASVMATRTWELQDRGLSSSHDHQGVQTLPNLVNRRGGWTQQPFS